MLGALARYMASRAVHGVADDIVRHAAWIGLAAVLGLIGIITLAFVAFSVLERSLGAVLAGVIVAGTCFALAALAAAVPSIVEKVQEEQQEPSAGPVGDAVAAIDQEAREAVDYLGPLRLVGSAFMLGMGMGRRAAARR